MATIHIIFVVVDDDDDDDDDDIISCCIRRFGISCNCHRWISPLIHWFHLLLILTPLSVLPLHQLLLTMNMIVVSLLPPIIHWALLLFHSSIHVTATAIRVGLVVSTAADESSDSSSSSSFNIRPVAAIIRVVFVLSLLLLPMLLIDYPDGYDFAPTPTAHSLLHSEIDSCSCCF